MTISGTKLIVAAFAAACAWFLITRPRAVLIEDVLPSVDSQTASLHRASGNVPADDSVVAWHRALDMIHDIEAHGVIGGEGQTRRLQREAKRAAAAIQKKHGENVLLALRSFDIDAQLTSLRCDGKHIETGALASQLMTYGFAREAGNCLRLLSSEEAATVFMAARWNRLAGRDASWQLSSAAVHQHYLWPMVEMRGSLAPGARESLLQKLQTSDGSQPTRVQSLMVAEASGRLGEGTLSPRYATWAESSGKLRPRNHALGLRLHAGDSR